MNLIYYTIGNNVRYINLLNLSINSLENFYSKNFELLFIVDDILKPDFEKLIKTKIPYTFFHTETKSLNDSSLNKFKIFEFENIKKYDKIIYCDCDTLWCGSPEKIFTMIGDHKIHVSNELHHNILMSHRYWSSDLFNNTEVGEISELRIQGFNAGFFGFSSKLTDLFKELYAFCIDNYHHMNECIEQPLMNVYLFRNKLYDLNINGLVNHNGYNIKNINDEILVHFAGGPGEYSGKMEIMNSFYEEKIKKK